MPTPALRRDFVDERAPKATELPAQEYNLNAQRTDEAWDRAYSSPFRPFIGTVATVTGAQGKAVTLAEPWASYVPVAGDKMILTFTNGSTVSSPTLAVNGGAAYPIVTPNGASNTQLSIAAASKVELTFDGSSWLTPPTVNTTYTAITAAEIDAGTVTTARLLAPNVASQKLARITGVPATPTSAGQVGQRAVDANYAYECVATNTWRRTPLASW